MAIHDDHQRPIVIKRIRKQAHVFHGGQWKIAYADFVTAMMAFFLLMWLIGSTTKGNLEGIAAYFKTPLLVALGGGSGSGDSSSIVTGGGKDLSRTEGQVMRGDLPAKKRMINTKAATAEMARERAKLTELKNQLSAAVENNSSLRQYRKQISFDITDEGLRVQIVDERNRPMFALGSARVQPYMKEILHEFARLLNQVENMVTIAGHTDLKPYASGEKGYSNWDLSADRANASRRELMAGGLSERKILRIVGLGSSVLMNRKDPYDPQNRRISIIVMNKNAEESVRKGLSAAHTEPEAAPEADAADGMRGAAAPVR